MSFIDRFRSFYHKIPKAPTTNFYLANLKTDPYSLLPPAAKVVDIGSKEAKGKYSFGKIPDSYSLICIDISEGPGVDIVADAHDLSDVVDTDSVDCVICISVLEHVAKPWIVVGEIERILKPGGIVYLNTPWVFPYHADPDDHYRFSHRGLALLADRFELIETGYNRGPASTMAHLSVYWFALLFSFNNTFLYGILIDIFGWVCFPIKYLDVWLSKHPKFYVLANGSFFLGRKRAST